MKTMNQILQLPFDLEMYSHESLGIDYKALPRYAMSISRVRLAMCHMLFKCHEYQEEFAKHRCHVCNPLLHIKGVLLLYF